MENIIDIQGLSKKYPSFSLSNVSFAVPEGCVAGFIGLNGQGKTTTIRTMLGLSPKDAGTVRMLGMDFETHESEIKDCIGVVFDEGYLYDSLKMKEMKGIVAKAYSHWDDAVYRALMQRFGLHEAQYIATLSKGMRMKFALTLALSHHAKLLIMDEPTSGLDPLVRMELLRILRVFMTEEGKGVLYSTHITSDLDQFADLIVFIHGGKIVLVEGKDTLLDTYVTVKGENGLLTPEMVPYFVHVQKGDYHFTGVTNAPQVVRKKMPGAVLERSSIEALMLAFIEGGQLND